MTPIQVLIAARVESLEDELARIQGRLHAIRTADHNNCTIVYKQGWRDIMLGDFKEYTYNTFEEAMAHAIIDLTYEELPVYIHEVYELAGEQFIAREWDSAAVTMEMQRRKDQQYDRA